MILFYILAAYCMVKFITLTRNNIKSAYAVNHHFEIYNDKPYYIYIESLLSAFVDSIVIFIVGSIVIYGLICVAEKLHFGSFL